MLLLRLLEAVDADDDALLILQLALVAVGGLLDLALDVALLDGAHAAAERVDLLDVLPRLALQLVGERLDVIRAGQRINRVGDAGLVGEDLLRAQREPRRLLGG